MESSVPESPALERRRPRLARLFDILAVLVIAAAAFKLFLAPRLFAPRIERPAPSLALAALDAPRFSLAAHRGHVVFLDFWASWCGPCQESLPTVERWARAHRDAEVYAVDAGEHPEDATRFARALHLENVLFDPKLDATHAFDVDGYPTMVVIDPAGMIRAKWTGFNPSIDDAMTRALGEFSGR